MSQTIGLPGYMSFGEVRDILVVQTQFTQRGNITKTLIIWIILLHVLSQQMSGNNTKGVLTIEPIM